MRALVAHPKHFPNFPLTHILRTVILPTMQTRPTPKSGFGNTGNDFTYVRNFEGHRTYKHGPMPMQVDEFQNSADFDDIFNPETDTDDGEYNG